MSIHRRLAAAVAVAVVATSIAGCTASSPSPAASTPRPARSVGAPLPPAGAGDVSFADGAMLPADVDVDLGDGLGSDPGWTALPETRPGIWRYTTVDGTCTASYRQGALGATPGMTDADASDANIAAVLGSSVEDIADILVDGRFARYQETGSWVDHRQVTIQILADGRPSGTFVAARAFVGIDFSVVVTVVCGGADINAAASEVLGRTAVEVLVP